MKLIALMLLSTFAVAVPAPRDVDVIAPDGTRKATYFPAERPGPAVLLLHMCVSRSRLSRGS